MWWWAKRRRANRLSAQNSAYFCLAESLRICRFDVFLLWIRFEFYACVWVFFRMLLHSLRVPRLITRILHSFFSFFFYLILCFVLSFILCISKHSFINGFFALTNTPWFTDSLTTHPSFSIPSFPFPSQSPASRSTRVPVPSIHHFSLSRPPSIRSAAAHIPSPPAAQRGVPAKRVPRVCRAIRRRRNTRAKRWESAAERWTRGDERRLWRKSPRRWCWEERKEADIANYVSRKRREYKEERRSWASFPTRRRRIERRTRRREEKWRERKGVMKNSVRNM